MITKFKIFESEEQFREVDLQQLWNDVKLYQKELFELSNPFKLNVYFEDLVLKKLLLNKDVEINRAISRIDGDVIYGKSGKVKEVFFDDYTLTKQVSVKLYKNEKFPLKRARSTKHIIARINNRHGFKEMKSPQIVKIYNSEPLEIEKKIELLRNTDKYNI